MRVLCAVLTGTTRVYVMPIGMVCFDLTDNRALESTMKESLLKKYCKKLLCDLLYLNRSPRG